MGRILLCLNIGQLRLSRNSWHWSRINHQNNSLFVCNFREQDMWQLAEDIQHHGYSRYHQGHKGRNNNNNNSLDELLSAQTSRCPAMCESVHTSGCDFISDTLTNLGNMALIFVEELTQVVFSATDFPNSRPTLLPAFMATVIHSLLSRATTTPGHFYTTTQNLWRSLAHHIITSEPT